MTKVTFDSLPEAVSNLFEKLNNIERLLQDQLQTTQEGPDQPLTVKEAAIFLDLSVPTLYNYVRRGEIPVSKRARRLYFSKQQLTQWLKAGSRKTNAEISAEANTYIQGKRKKAPNDRV